MAVNAIPAILFVEVMFPLQPAVQITALNKGDHAPFEQNASVEIYLVHKQFSTQTVGSRLQGRVSHNN